MIKQHTPRTQTLRFRRWSRKAYAAFASICREVTIGCLKRGITEQALAKNLSVAISLPVIVEQEEKDNFYKEEESIAIAMLCRMNLLIPVQAESAAAPQHKIQNNSLRQRAESISYKLRTFRSFYLSGKIIKI